MDKQYITVEENHCGVPYDRDGYRDEDKRWGGESIFTETAYTPDERGKLYRSLTREYGRCTGYVYRDVKVNDQWIVERVGWVFEKRTKYSDCDQYFVAETWVTLHSAPPTRTTTYHVMSF